MNIHRILHAGYIFESGGVRIAMDPIFENPFSGNCHAFPEVKFEEAAVASLWFDAVFISHYHEDHCSLVSLAKLDRATPIYLYCLHPELFDWIRELGFTNIHSLAMNVPVTKGGFTITPRRALDADIDSVLQIEAEGLKILNVVDSWIDDQTLQQLKDFAPWDLVLWPFQTMREIEVLDPRRSEDATGEIPHEWSPQLRSLNPKFLVPSACQFTHEPWSWYRKEFFPISYLSFEKQVSAIIPNTRIVRLNPGCGFSLTTEGLTPLERLPWIQPIGSQDLDYEYDPYAVVPATAEVAMNFPKLTSAQTERLAMYVETELCAKLETLDAPEGDYFQSPRTWRLRIWDDRQQAVVLTFKIEGTKATPIAQTETFDWLTEIPAWTLARILQNGQSLSASYIRVNDHKYPLLQETEIADADVLEDPLIRALFTVPFGAYQQAQLRQLQGVSIS